MGELGRYVEPRASYYVTSITTDSKKIFASEKACKLLIVTMQFYKYYLDYRIYGFVVMPDHFHAIIEPGPEYNITAIMNKIKGNFGNKYNRLAGRSGTVWQSKFYGEGIRNQMEMRRKIDYIHNNPVRAGLTDTPAAYEYSSYRYYQGQIKDYLLDIPG
ncbi:MAG: REP-associated tyrosine transposase [Acidobacteriota bacterium]